MLKQLLGWGCSDWLGWVRSTNTEPQRAVTGCGMDQALVLSFQNLTRIVCSPCHVRFFKDARLLILLPSTASAKILCCTRKICGMSELLEIEGALPRREMFRSLTQFVRVVTAVCQEHEFSLGLSARVTTGRLWIVGRCYGSQCAMPARTVPAHRTWYVRLVVPSHRLFEEPLAMCIDSALAR